MVAGEGRASRHPGLAMEADLLNERRHPIMSPASSQQASAAADRWVVGKPVRGRFGSTVVRDEQTSQFGSACIGFSKRGPGKRSDTRNAMRSQSSASLHSCGLPAGGSISVN